MEIADEMEREVWINTNRLDPLPNSPELTSDLAPVMQPFPPLPPPLPPYVPPRIDPPEAKDWFSFSDFHPPARRGIVKVPNFLRDSPSPPRGEERELHPSPLGKRQRPPLSPIFAFIAASAK